MVRACKQGCRYAVESGSEEFSADVFLFQQAVARRREDSWDLYDLLHEFQMCDLASSECKSTAKENCGEVEIRTR